MKAFPKFWRINALFIAIYVLSYACLYLFRSPAANLAYFCYIDNPRVERLDAFLYNFYYPIYRVHHDFLNGSRHNNDRPPLVDNPDA